MRKDILTLMSVVFIDLLGFGVIIPLLPLIVKNVGGNEFTIGVLIASYSLFQFIFSPILGKLSDKYGRKPILIISSFLHAFSYLIMFFSNNLWLLFVGRCLGGIGGANISVGQAYIADVSKSHERSKLMALFGSMFSFGMIIGPFIGGFFSSHFSLNTPFLVTAIFSFISSFLILLLIPESNKNLSKEIKIKLLDIKAIKETMKIRNIKFFYLFFFFMIFCFALTWGIFPVFSAIVFSLNEAQIGYYFALFGLVGFIVQAFLIGFLLKRISEKTLIKYGTILFGIGFLLTGLSTTTNLLIISGVISSIGFGLITPNIQSLVSLETREGNQGIIMGTLHSFGSMARIFGPLLGGALAGIKINSPYIASSLLILIIYLWGKQYLKK